MRGATNKEVRGEDESREVMEGGNARFPMKRKGGNKR